MFKYNTISNIPKCKHEANKIEPNFDQLSDYADEPLKYIREQVVAAIEDNLGTRWMMSALVGNEDPVVTHLRQILDKVDKEFERRGKPQQKLTPSVKVYTEEEFMKLAKEHGVE